MTKDNNIFDVDALQQWLEAEFPDLRWTQAASTIHCDRLVTCCPSNIPGTVGNITVTISDRNVLVTGDDVEWTMAGRKWPTSNDCEAFRSIVGDVRALMIRYADDMPLDQINGNKQLFLNIKQWLEVEFPNQKWEIGLANSGYKTLQSVCAAATTNDGQFYVRVGEKNCYVGTNNPFLTPAWRDLPCCAHSPVFKQIVAAVKATIELCEDPTIYD